MKFRIRFTSKVENARTSAFNVACKTRLLCQAKIFIPLIPCHHIWRIFWTHAVRRSCPRSKMNLLSPSISNTCATCGHGAERCCSRCKGTPTADYKNLISVYYCGRDCQQSHWTTHKILCKQARLRQATKTLEDSLQKVRLHACIRCDGDGALNCHACKGAPGGSDPKKSHVVWYWGAGCQEKDRAAHESACHIAHDRRAVLRAASIAQEIYLIFARTTFMWWLDRIEKDGNIWWLSPTDKHKGKSALTSFPPACVTTSEEEKAILSFLNCQSAVSYLHKLLKHSSKVG